MVELNCVVATETGWLQPWGNRCSLPVRKSRSRWTTISHVLRLRLEIPGPVVPLQFSAAVYMASRLPSSQSPAPAAHLRKSSGGRHRGTCSLSPSPGQPPCPPRPPPHGGPATERVGGGGVGGGWGSGPPAGMPITGAPAVPQPESTGALRSRQHEQQGHRPVRRAGGVGCSPLAVGCGLMTDAQRPPLEGNGLWANQRRLAPNRCGLAKRPHSCSACGSSLTRVTGHRKYHPYPLCALWLFSLWGP